MNTTARQQIQYIISDLDNTYHVKMTTSTREEELYEQKYAISDWIYCLYSNDEKAENNNQDFKDSIAYLIEKFYESKDKVYLWDKNWTFDDNSTVYAKRFGKFYISKGGQHKLVSPEEFISSSDNNKQHKFIDLKINRLEIYNNSWFYFRGNKYLGTTFLTRLYFNFNYDFEKIVSFSKQLCDELNQWFIPFEYKFATKKTERYDKGVLYTSREHYYIVFHIIKKLASEQTYNGLFEEPTLAFTKKTSLTGISFGEEPPVRSSSFGKYRADIMADIYIDYYRSLKYSKKSGRLINFFHKKLAEFGFNTKDFFRNPNTNYPYAFSVFSKKTPYKRQVAGHAADKYLTWALNAGKLICKQAIIIEQRGILNCCWMSIIEDEFQYAGYQLTDDSFAEGRLGIVYFLAKLYSYFPHEYIFKDISEIVLADIQSSSHLLSETSVFYINQARQWLKTGKRLLNLKSSRNYLQVFQSESILTRIDAMLDMTNTYSVVGNEAPQPIIKKGYAGIGLILFAIYENDAEELAKSEGYYSHEAFLKLINQTMF
jgi:hypothetical protein